MPTASNLANSANWHDVYINTFTLPPRIDRSEDIELPIQFDQPTLAILVTSADAKPHWRLAGYLNQKVRLGLTVGGQPEADVDSSIRLFLNQIRLLNFSQVTSSYALSFGAVPWLNNITLHIWQYSE